MTAVPKPQYYTADEYFALTPESNQHTELREGEIVYLAAPTQQHQEIAGGVYADIRAYIRSKGGACRVVIAPFDVRLNEYNVVQPDVLVVCDPEKLDGKRCNGAPDWIVEVLSTNRSDDLIDKLGLYQKAGVREYWIVDPKSEKTLVYFFERSDLPDIYTFDTPIPVGIYDKALSIRVADLLE